MAEATPSGGGPTGRDPEGPARENGTLPLSSNGIPPGPIEVDSGRSRREGLLAPGERIDDYDVVVLLGRGGMGQVYRVRHRLLDREFALKVISSQHIGPEAVGRFRREMKAAGRTNHPNVIVATDAGECRGLNYLVMELVTGCDLSALVRRLGPLPVADACELVRQAAEGLQAIHEAGLVHRDIKPSNLMLTPEGTVRVL